MKLKKLSKKAQGFGINKTLGLILVILAVVLGLIFLFKADILRHIRNIGPDFNITEEDIDVRETPEESYQISKVYLNVYGDKLILTVLHSCDEIEFHVLDDALVFKRLWRDGVFPGRTKKLSLLEPSGEGESPNTGKFKEGIYHAEVYCLKEGGETGEKGESNKVEITQKILEDAENYDSIVLSSLEGKGCDDFTEIIADYSKKYGVDPLLTMSIIIQESDCNPKAKYKSVGAEGLMQLMQGTVEDPNTGGCANIGIDFEDVKKSSEKNIECGLYILKSKYSYFNHKACNSLDDCPKKFNTCGANNNRSCSSKCEEKVCKYEFDGCNNLNAYYSGWNATLRAYNGWGCNSDSNLNKQDYYVEDVYDKYASLGGTALA